jgi:hypothetical protein
MVAGGGQVSPDFLRTLVRAAILANESEYALLRPALLQIDQLAAGFENGAQPSECARIGL